jgi:hypothetical protein
VIVLLAMIDRGSRSGHGSVAILAATAGGRRQRRAAACMTTVDGVTQRITPHSRRRLRRSCRHLFLVGPRRRRRRHPVMRTMAVYHRCEIYSHGHRIKTIQVYGCITSIPRHRPWTRPGGSLRGNLIITTRQPQRRSSFRRRHNRPGGGRRNAFGKARVGATPCSRSAFDSFRGWMASNRRTMDGRCH